MLNLSCDLDCNCTNSRWEKNKNQINQECLQKDACALQPKMRSPTMLLMLDMPHPDSQPPPSFAFLPPSVSASAVAAAPPSPSSPFLASGAAFDAGSAEASFSWGWAVTANRKGKQQHHNVFLVLPMRGVKNWIFNGLSTSQGQLWCKITHTIVHILKVLGAHRCILTS